MGSKVPEFIYTPPSLIYTPPHPRPVPWKCNCGYRNGSTSYRIFAVPDFECGGCGRDFFLDHDIDFCLGDIWLNQISPVHSIMHQQGPECFTYACCQAIRIGYLVDTAFKGEWPNEKMLTFNPINVVKYYYQEYHDYIAKSQLPTLHKVMKILDFFKKVGIPLDALDPQSVFKVQEITFIDRTHFSTICRLLANGEPVVAVLQQGASFGFLQYGQFYKAAPYDEEMVKCNEMHKKFPHSPHAVVLVGVRTNHETKERGYWVVNSWSCWCKRKITSSNQPEGAVGQIVQYGIGLIREEDLIANVIRFWQPGCRPSALDRSCLIDEPFDGNISMLNYWLYQGVRFDPFNPYPSES